MLSLLANSYSHTRFLRISSVVATEPPTETELTGWIGDETRIRTGDNILFYYDFEGGSANDKSGNNKHGTVTGNIFQQSSEMNGQYYATGDGLSTGITTTMVTTPLTWVKNNGLIMSFWFKSPAANNAEGRPSILFSFSSTCMLQIQGNSVLQMKFLPNAALINYGTEYSKWYHFLIIIRGNNVSSLYVDNVLKFSGNISLPNSPVDLQTISTTTNTLKKAMFPDSGIDDIRFFNKDTISAEHMLALSNSLYTESGLMLRLTLQTDGTDRTGNYNGVVFGNCITNTRAKYGSWSLRSDGVVASTKYIEMPAINFIKDMGMSMSFWFYNESGQSTGDTRMIEAKRQNNTISAFYIEQYRNDRTKFRFSDNTGCIFFASPLNSWHKFVVTISGSNAVNIWIDNVKVVSNITVSQGMSNSFDAGWRIGANNSNVANLCSFAGSIQEFKIWNRVLTNTEAIDVV